MSSDQPDPGQPRQFLVDQLRDIFTATATELSRRLREGGFYAPTPAQIALLSYVTPEGVRLVDLAQRAGVSKQAIHQMVNQLEQVGVLERVPDADDGRARLVRPTAYALDGYKRARMILSAIHEEWRSVLGDDLYTKLEEAAAILNHS